MGPYATCSRSKLSERFFSSVRASLNRRQAIRCAFKLALIYVNTRGRGCYFSAYDAVTGRRSA